MNDFRDDFLLDPEVTFLNHGSFGATPRPVFEAYQKWQREVERQPIQFLEHELPGLLANARQVLADYLSVETADLVFIPNATFGVNVVANSLALGPGDEVISSDHEYGACANVWRYWSSKRGFRFIQTPVKVPTLPRAAADEAMVDQLWSAVTPNTRVIFLSHITSPTAVTLPVDRICSRAAEVGIITVIDGAHAPGQIDINLDEIGPDFYTGNCHKWLCAPKGSAFLYARPDRQSIIEPLVVGWGWGEDRALTFGSDFIDYLQWLGTDDPASYLAAAAAVAYQEEHDWPAVRQRCHELASHALTRICELFELSPLYHDHSFFHQMAIAPLPPINNLSETKRLFYNRYKVEIPFIHWNERSLIRVSVQAYNNQSDIDRLLEALAEFFKVGE